MRANPPVGATVNSAPAGDLLRRSPHIIFPLYTGKHPPSKGNNVFPANFTQKPDNIVEFATRLR